MDRLLFSKFYFFFFWNGELYIYISIQKKNVDFFLFYSNVTEGESNRRGPRLICESRNKKLWSDGSVQLLSVRLESCMFILFCEVESMSSVGDAFCQGLICRWLFIQRSFNLLFSMPSSFLYVLLFMCNVFRYLDYIQDMPFQCTLDVVYVSSPYLK